MATIRITRQGRERGCRRDRSDKPSACAACSQPIPAGEQHIRQSLTSGGRGNARRYCARCAVARGVAYID